MTEVRECVRRFPDPVQMKPHPLAYDESLDGTPAALTPTSAELGLVSSALGLGGNGFC